MTADPTLTLLAIMVWPFVALVSCWSLYLTARLVVNAICYSRSAESRASDLRWIEFWSSVLQSTLPALVRAVVNDQANGAKSNVPQTAERALLALIASNGGIPARRGEDTVRLLVHEVRKLYDELEHPTEPVRVEGGSDGGDGLDDLVDDLFSSGLIEQDFDEDGNRQHGATAVMDEEI